MITFTVHGVAIPKGSTRAFMPKGWKRPIVTSDNAESKTWEQKILEAALNVIGAGEPLECPMSLLVEFFLPRPASAPKRVIHPAKKPDLDKLVRCVKDAMKRAGIYRDDSQVVTLRAAKHFAGGVFDPLGAKGVPRAFIAVDEIRPPQPTTVKPRGLFDGQREAV